MSMKHFETEKEALSYAEENLGKYDVLVCTVADKMTFLTSTALPLEEELRANLEEVMTQFMVENLNVPEEEAGQVSIELGAEYTAPILDAIADRTDRKILSADLDY